MKYYALKINNQLVRKVEIIQDRDYDGAERVDMYCSFTDDLNLACKFTREEMLNNDGGIQYIKMYFDEFETINGFTKIDSYDFVEVEL